MTVPRLVKWPFFLADLLLLLAGGWLVWQGHAETLSGQLLLVAAVVLGAVASCLPFSMEHRAELRFAESTQLANTVGQIKHLELLQTRIDAATASWQTAQEQSAKTVTGAREIADRITAEAKAFSEFMGKANDSEKTHLRLEVEKARRSEGDWLQVTVRLLDHTHALHRASVQSGQRNLIDQIGQFQNACRDAVRRVGLTAFTPSPNEPYDERGHQPIDGKTPEPGAQVSEVLAPGYTFQGQLLRKAAVMFTQPSAATEPGELDLPLHKGETAGGEENASDTPSLL